MWRMIRQFTDYFFSDDTPGKVVLKVNLIEHENNLTKENILPKVHKRRCQNNLSYRQPPSRRIAGGER
jgi:hypothetical protein